MPPISTAFSGREAVEKLPMLVKGITYAGAKSWTLGEEWREERSDIEMREDMKSLINTLVERIKRGYDPEKIILYGSYVYGTPHESSDIDIFIIKEDGERPLDRRLKIRRLVRDLNKRIAISPVVYTPGEVEKRMAIGDGFIREVLGRGVVVYERR